MFKQTTTRAGGCLFATMDGMNINEHVVLAPYTMFQVGGAARYFVEVTSDDEVKEAIVFAREKKIPHFILGGGSNILVSDEGFSGVVIQMTSSSVLWSADDREVTADAGVSWDALVAESVAHHCFGLENLSGIPGSVGGAVVGNIGAYGSEVNKTLAWVEALDTKTMSVVRIENAECRYGYRDSIFKHEEGKHFIVLRAAFLLGKEGVLDHEYKDVESYEKQKGAIATLKEMRTAILEIRGSKFPSDGSIGTAGSFFKNPVVDSVHAAAFLSRFPDAPNFPQEDGTVKLSAAWIIDHVLHLRGARVGQVGTWESQALVLVNYGGASAAEIKNFAQTIINNAKKETQVVLSPEVVSVGE